MATLELQGLTKRFGEFTAVDSMNLKACLLYTSDAADE